MTPQFHFWVCTQRTQGRVSKKHMYTHVRSSIIHNSQKQPKCPLVSERINRMWSIHTMEYYSALKSKGILTMCSNTDEL